MLLVRVCEGGWAVDKEGAWRKTGAGKTHNILGYFGIRLAPSIGIGGPLFRWRQPLLLPGGRGGHAADPLSALAGVDPPAPAACCRCAPLGGSAARSAAPCAAAGTPAAVAACSPLPAAACAPADADALPAPECRPACRGTGCFSGRGALFAAASLLAPPHFRCSWRNAC